MRKTFKNFKEQCKKAVEEDEGGAPTNSIGGGNIASRDIPFVTKPKVKIVGPEPVTPSTFSDKIFRRKKPAI